jgi:hypothetical protein
MTQTIFDLAAWRTVLVDSLVELGATVARFLPSLVATLVILGVGWLVSRVVEAVAARTLHQLGLDRVSRRLRLTEFLGQAGITAPPSRITARLLFWVLMLTFLLSAVDTLGLSAVTSTIDRLIAYLPSVIAAGLIVILGLLLGRLVGNLVSSGAVAAGLDQARRLGAAAQSLVVMVVGVLAIEQLGVQAQILVTVISVVLGAVSLTLGVAFALGARPVVSHILAGHFLRQSLVRGGAVEVEGRRGVVERVGPVDTLIRDGERAWSIPNARLLEEVVGR